MIQGTKRSPGVTILLFVVTLGIYWWFWIYKAFDEVAKHENKRLPAAKFLPPMIVLWLAGVGGAVYRTIVAFEEAAKARESGAAAQNPFAVQFQQFAEPIVIAGIVASVALYVLQILYLRTAHGIVEAAARERGDPNPPAPVLPVLFNILLAASWIPFAGSVATLGAIIVAIIWVLQVQGAMNRYWDATLMAPPMPPAGWMPSPGGPGTVAPYGPPPARR